MEKEKVALAEEVAKLKTDNEKDNETIIKVAFYFVLFVNSSLAICFIFNCMSFVEFYFI